MIDTINTNALKDVLGHNKALALAKELYFSKTLRKNADEISTRTVLTFAKKNKMDPGEIYYRMCKTQTFERRTCTERIRTNEL